jgi:signal transduction histidine kinase
MVAFGLSRGENHLNTDDAGHLEWLVDSGQRLSLAQVASKPTSAWQSWDGKSYLRTPAGDALWLRLTLRNPSSEPMHGVLQDTEVYTARVEAWWARLGAPVETWPHRISGADFGAGQRQWWSWSAAFLVTIPPNGEQTLYLRETDSFCTISWWLWWPRMEAYFSAQILEAILKSLCLGAMAAVLIYNFVLWVRLRFPDMGIYVAYGASMWIFNFAESGGSAVWGDLIGASWRLPIEPISLAASALFVITFARLFLRTSTRLPRIDLILRGIFGIWIVILVGALTMPLTRWEFWLGISIFGVAIVHLLLMAVAIASWIRGDRTARFFVLAFGVLTVGGLTAAISWGSGGNTHVFVIILLIACTLEMLLLSFAVADRFGQTQQHLVRETEHRRMLQETYTDELAIEVAERTRDLALANADKDRMLTVIGHDLRGPLTGLMRSADQATGPLAHETTRIVRTLLFLIEDLVLWARMRAGTPAIAPHRARDIVLPATRLYDAMAERKEIRLVSEIPNDLRVLTDLVLAQTLVRNLLANAVKFARSEIILQAQLDEEGLCFSVANDGPSLSPEIASRLTEGSDEFGTGGLGLRLCREICQQLGIRLKAEAGTEAGMRFHFTLPIVKETQ